MRHDGWFFKVLVPLLTVTVLFFGIQDVGPAYAALFRVGELGTFTARDESCNKTCSWQGDFVSDDGVTVRRNVRLASGGDVDDPGDRVRARDTDPRGRLSRRVVMGLAAADHSSRGVGGRPVRVDALGIPADQAAEGRPGASVRAWRVIRPDTQAINIMLTT